jgi:hypothetical protein
LSTQTADALRQAAQRLTVQIQSPRTSPTDAQHLEQVQRLARAIADHLDDGTLDPFLRRVKTLAHVEFLLLWNNPPMTTWDVSLINRVVALGLDASSVSIARESLLALDPVAVTMNDDKVSCGDTMALGVSLVNFEATFAPRDMAVEVDTQDD